MWRKASEHASSISMEKGIITDLPGRPELKFTKERNLLSVRALDFLVCGAVTEPFVPADGSIPTVFVFVVINASWLPESTSCGNVLATTWSHTSTWKHPSTLFSWLIFESQIRFCSVVD